MKVRVDTITSSPSGLVLGLQIRGPRDSWLKFATCEIPWRMVGEQTMREFYAWLDAEREDLDLEEDVPLFAHETE